MKLKRIKINYIDGSEDLLVTPHIPTFKDTNIQGYILVPDPAKQLDGTPPKPALVDMNKRVVVPLACVKMVVYIDEADIQTLEDRQAELRGTNGSA